jgi:hypothetical protein
MDALKPVLDVLIVMPALSINDMAETFMNVKF